MPYMLDTNACVDLLKSKSKKLAKQIARLSPNDLAMSAITLGELSYGAAKSGRPLHHEKLLAAICSVIAVLPFDPNAAHEYGALRSELELLGSTIGPLDLLIAAHALATGSILITDNIREFKRVPGLQVQNWRR